MLELLTTKQIETFSCRSQRSITFGDFRYLSCGVSLIFMTKYTHYSLFALLMKLYHSFTKCVCLDMLPDLLSLWFPQPFPSPSKKRSHEIKKKYPAERARFSRRGKRVGKWIISDQKQLYFEGRSRHLLAQLSRCYKKIKGGFFCHLKSVSGSKKKVCCSVCDF